MKEYAIVFPEAAEEISKQQKPPDISDPEGPESGFRM
jgi:hypothetical protein